MAIDIVLFVVDNKNKTGARQNAHSPVINLTENNIQPVLSPIIALTTAPFAARSGAVARAVASAPRFSRDF